MVFPVYEVSASRLFPRAEDTSGSTTKLDRAAIALQNPSSTAELLRLVAGIHVQESGGLAVVHLRGADPNLTLVLVDGVQVNDPTDSRGGAFDLGSIDPSEIESVQVVRGPASAVHGSDALAGVLDIRTRRGGTRRWAELEGGDPSSLRLAAGLRQNLGAAQLGAQLHYRDHEEENAQRDESAFGATAQGSLQSDSNQLDLDFRFGQGESDYFPESSGGPELAFLREREHEETENWQLALGWTRQLPAQSDLRLDISSFDSGRDVDSPGIALDETTLVQPASALHDDLRRDRFGLTLRTQRGARQGALGAELRLEDGDSEGTLDFIGATDFSLYRRIGGLYAELLQQTERGLTLQGALRLDATESQSPQWSPRLSAQLRLPVQGARLKSSYGKAFKLPSFYSLSHPLIGDPTLLPERSESFDVGILQSFTSWDTNLEFTWFTTRFEDLVDYDPTVAPFGRMVNRDTVSSQGFESSLSAQLPRGNEVRLQLHRAETEVEATGDPLNDRPDWQANFAFTHRRPAGHSIELRWLFVGDIPSYSIPAGSAELAKYSRLDLSLQVQLTHQIRATLAIENLTDTDYEAAIGVPAPGIFPRLGIRGDF